MTALNSRKPLVLIAAAVVAIVAVVVLYMYVNGQKDKAFGNAKMISVWVVKTPVPKGTYGQETQSSIVKSKIPKQFFPANAILITRLDNLSLYWQEGARRRNVIDNPKRDRVENYESSNDAYVIEDYDGIALIENIEIVEAVA